MRDSEVRMIPEFFDGRAGTHVHYIHDRAPVAAKLAYLLRVDIHQERHLVRLAGGFGLTKGSSIPRRATALRIRIKVPCVLR